MKAIAEQVALPPGALAARGPANAADLNAAEANLVQPTKLFIGGISRRTTTKQLRDHFSKHGRVLDCVAMRQPDGRPRGFGYVTLDSPVAAERFLREPQMIDDRIVDMKPAVPEAVSQSAVAYGMGKTEYSGTPNSDPASMLLGFGGYDALPPPQQAMAHTGVTYPWLEDPGFYCDGGFGGVMVPDIGVPSIGSLSAVGHPVMENSDFFSHHATPTSTTVPDCLAILRSTKSGTAPGQFVMPDPAPAPITIPAPSSKPLGISSREGRPVPLGDVTNLIDDNSSSARQADVKLCDPMRIETSAVQMRRTAPAVVSPIGSDCGQDCFVFEDDKEEFPEVAPESIKPTSTNGSEAGLDEQSSPRVPYVVSALSSELDDLPSIGSSQHATGECRRCNFFAKGRCRNGRDCAFCHLPHERRKLSRQEKREQQAARLARESGSATDDGDDTDDADEDATVNSTSAATSPTSLAAPPGKLLPNAELPLGPLPAKVLPPGLRPPGLAPPAAPPAQCLLPPHMVRCAPFETTGSFTAPSTGLLATNPVQTPTYMAPLPPLLATPAPAATAPTASAAAPPVTPIAATPKAPTKEMCTVSTQTDDDCGWCPYCEGSLRGSLLSPSKTDRKSVGRERV